VTEVRASTAQMLLMSNRFLADTLFWFSVGLVSVYSFNNTSYKLEINLLDLFSNKFVQRRKLDIFLGGGSVTYCRIGIGTENRRFSAPTTCRIAADTGFNYPNGITRDADNLIYVGSSFIDKVRVMTWQKDGSLRENTVLKLGMPIDNLAVDAQGDIFVAGFPQVTRVLKSFNDPYGEVASSTLFRIRKTTGDYIVTKLLEDADGSTFGGATVVRHDIQTGRLFIGGMFELLF
jgi:hypothetical protein